MTEGLGKLYSNLAACSLQQEHFTKAIQACQLALQVQPPLQEICVALRLLCVFSPPLGVADSSYCVGSAPRMLCWHCAGPTELFHDKATRLSEMRIS